MAVVDERQTDRHTMQSEVGYLFSGYGREGRRGEKRRRERERGEKGEMGAASVRGSWKRERTQAGS